MSLVLVIALFNAVFAWWDGRKALRYFVASLFLGPWITLLIYGTYETPGGHLHQIDLLRPRGVAPLSR